MRITTSDLRAALQATGVGVSARPEVPALAGVRLTIADGSAVLATTDFNTWCSYRCLVDGAETIDVLVSHRLLTSVAKVARAAVVELAVVASKLAVTATGNAWALPVFDTAPPLPPRMPAPFGSIDATVLRQLVRAAAPAASRQEQPAFLQALQFRAKGDRLELSATDRYRAHIVEAPFTNLGLDGRIFPPAAELVRIVDALNGDVQMFADRNGGTFGLSDERLSVQLRLIDGEPPDLAKHLADLPPVKATTLVDAGDLSDALDAIAPAGEPAAVITVTPDGFTISASTDDAAAVAEVSDYTHDGRGLKCSINHAFLADALKMLSTPRVRLSWTEPTKPVILTADGTTNQCFLMPIRLSDGGWLGSAARSTDFAGAPA